jgi:hypothetical protein
MAFIPDKKAAAFIPDRLSPNEYSGLTAEDAKKKSSQIYDVAKQHGVSYEGVQRLTNDADDINMDAIFSQPAPDIAIEDSPRNKFGLVAGLSTGQRTRKRTEDETIRYNMSKVPNTPRAQYMAKEYLRQRKIRKKVEAEKTVDVKDVLDLNFYLSYFAGIRTPEQRETSAIAIGQANLFRNKPKAMGVAGQDTFLSDNPDMSFVPSVFDVLLDGDRAEEIQTLVDMGDTKKREEYYKAKGIIGISEFHERKDNREYMIWSDTLKALKGNEVRNAIERLQDPELNYAKSDFTEHGLSPNYDRDVLLMRNHFFNIEEAQARGVSVAANLSDMGLDMVKYMGEIALLSGITGAGATKLKTAATFHRAGVPRLIAANVGTLSSAITMTAANPSRVANLTIGRMTDKGYVGDFGQFLKTEEGQSIVKALPKSFAEATVTQFVEQKGDDIVKGLFSVGSKSLSKLPRGMVSKFDDIAAYMKETGIRSFDKLPKGMQATIQAIKSRIASINKAGQFNGVFGENLEEYVEQIVKPILLLDDQYRDASDSFLDRVVKSLEIDPEQVILQTILFTAIPFATGAIGSSAETINWAGQKVKAVIQGQPTLPQVKSRFDLENSIREEYGLDRQQSEDVATMLDNHEPVNKIENHIQSFGGEFSEFSFDDHNNRKALATMLVDRGLVTTEAIALADIVTNLAKKQDATVPEIVNTDEFKNDVRDTEKEPVNSVQQTIDDAVDESAKEPLVDISTLTDEQLNELEDKIPDLTTEQRASLRKQRDTARAKRDAEQEPEEGKKLEQPDFIAGEETKPRGLSKSVEEEAQRKNIVEAFDNVPDYQVVPMDRQYDEAARIITDDFEFAKRVAMGVDADVERAKAIGIIPEMLYVAVTDKAVRDGDLALVEDLAINSGLIAEATTMGQRIRSLGELGDHSPIRAINKIRDARSDAATKDEKGTIKNLRKDLDKTQKKLEKAEQKLAEKELDVVIKETSTGTEAPKAKSPKTKGYGSRNTIVTRERADAALKRLGDTSTLFAGIDPKKLADVLEVSTFHLEAIGRNFAQWSKTMIDQLGDGIKPHLQDLWKKAGSALSVADVKDSLGIISKGAKQGKDIAQFTAQIQKLAKALVIQGFDTRGKLVNRMHADLQVIFPDITKRDTSDAISGFGKFRRLSTEEIDTILRDIKGQLQQISKLQDMASGIAPAKTGVERRTPSAEERALIKQVEEAKKKGGFVVTDPAKQLKTALGAIKTRLKNAIADLEKQIKERKKTVKTKRPSPTDAEIEALKIHRDSLRAQFDALFGESKLTMAQRIANAKSRVRTDIKKIQDRIDKGDFAPKKRVAIDDDIDLKTLRHAKDNAKRAFDAAQEVFENEGGISKEEVRNIVGLSQLIEDTKIAMEAGERRTANSKPTDVETEYGMAVVAFEKYVEAVQLKAAKKAIPQRLKTWFNLFNLELLSDIAGTAKTIRASMDNSFIGRQGIKLFYLGITGNFEAGKIWMETFMRSIHTIVGSFAGKPVMDVLRAEILSDPQYNLMRRAKVATAVAEEEFPTHWPSKIPVIGMFFKASEDAFTASAYYMRYRTARMYFDIARKTGVDLNDKNELESIGILVNSLTARGDTGNYGGKDDLINRVFWSPKMIKSNFDVFTAHRFNQNMSKFAHRQAAKNLVRIIFGQAAVLFIANLIWPDSVEDDRTSSDFGKIKIGNTRFDISGGSGSMIVLAMRLAKGSFKSSTGRQVELDSEGFGGLSSMDLIWNFLENKLSPGAASVKQLLLMKNNAVDWRTGREVTFIDVVEGLAVPLPFENLKELMEDPDSAPVLIAMLAELHGISAMNYKTKFKGFK